MAARLGVTGVSTMRGVVVGRAHQAALPLGRSVIVTIGIDRYAHWDQLECAKKDADSTRDAFLARGFEEVVAPFADEQATRDALNALVVDGLRELSEHDQLVIFYAGHGGTRTEHPGGRKTQTGYLIPVDAARDGDNVASWIELSAWLRSISLLPPRHILVILDSCSSGIALHAPYRSRGARREAHGALTMLQARASRRVITSAIGDEPALDNGPRDGQSLFTGCLLDVLDDAIRTGDRLTGSALGLRVQTRVSDYQGWTQTPDFGAFDGDDRGELVIPGADGELGEISGITGGSTDFAPVYVPERRSLTPRLTSSWHALRRRWGVWPLAGIVFWILFLIGSALR